MAEGDFQVVFRGELTGDQPEDAVRQQLAALFKMPEAKVANLFTGKPIVVKRNLDEATARKFENAFCKAGARCEIRSASAGAGESSAGAPAEPEPRTLAETPGDPADSGHKPASGDNSAGAEARASMAAAGDPNNTLLEMDIPGDLSALDVDESDAPLAPETSQPEPDIDTSDLSVAENDVENLSQSKPPPPADIDTGDLSLE